ncbi:hypothetical protein SAMN04488502_1011200 [Dendrosporobacter quercicolus]|uniref:Uncharacterized protein n=1 Tax=Dendrosporobacter quercicolus TaxID=146817 RepID=A0A1G9P399_9FIRM|nr:hypothetical protein SAMN04488502_1011200 [Dendrosporobacter quercicolus]
MQGLQCWDANGNLTLDLTDRLTRVLGEFKTGTVNGSITDANIANGTPWILNLSMGRNIAEQEKIFDILINGSTISWTFTNYSSSFPGTAISRKFIYGVY